MIPFIYATKFDNDNAAIVIEKMFQIVVNYGDKNDEKYVVRGGSDRARNTDRGSVLNLPNSDYQEDVVHGGSNGARSHGRGYSSTVSI